MSPRIKLSSRARTWGVLALLGLGVLQGAGPRFLALGGLLQPGPRAARLTHGAYVMGVWTGRSYAYLLLPKDAQATDIVLIDTGSDGDGAAINAALASLGCTRLCVTTVLLTHGHADHTAGLDLFPHAEVFAHPADGALLRGDLGPRSSLMRLAMRIMPRQRHTRQTQDLFAGQTLWRAGHAITAVGLPGHTQGSYGFVAEGGLFAGDAVMAASINAPALRPYADVLADRPDILVGALQRLGAIPLAWVADGHTGLVVKAGHAL